MINLKIWDKLEPLYLPSGRLLEPEAVMERWPHTQHFTTVLEMSGKMTMAIDSMPVLVSVYNIDPALSDEDKLAAIQDARERAQNPEPADAQPGTLSELKELQLIQMEAMAEMDERQTNNTLTLFLALADMVEIMLEG